MTRIRSWPRRRLYPVVGMLLAVGAPVGLIITRRMLAGLQPVAGWLASELSANSLTYTYVTLSTALVFAVLGYALGEREDELRLTSLIDPVTGIANRRQFEQVLDERLALAARYKTSLSLLMLDLDRFKELNDSRGHAAGDVALQHVARCIAGTCRLTDLPARIGGDEFAVVVTATAAGLAAELGERIRSTLATQARPPAIENCPLTVSIGIADIDTTGSEDRSALLAAADRALFQAKSQGRDRVVVATAAPRAEITPLGPVPIGGLSPPSPVGSPL
jgi:diguanylate cyclase (GGDEF)-like protein